MLGSQCVSKMCSFFLWFSYFGLCFNVSTYWGNGVWDMNNLHKSLHCNHLFWDIFSENRNRMLWKPKKVYKMYTAVLCGGYLWSEEATEWLQNTEDHDKAGDMSFCHSQVTRMYSVGRKCLTSTLHTWALVGWQKFSHITSTTKPWKDKVRKPE